MSDQNVTVSKDTLSSDQENELICERLLRWRKLFPSSPLPGIEFIGWRDNYGFDKPTPAFTTWAEVGLVLEALSSRDCKSAVGDKSISGGWWCTVGPICELRDTGPAAVRAAALEYIRSMK